MHKVPQFTEHDRPKSLETQGVLSRTVIKLCLGTWKRTRSEQNHYKTIAKALYVPGSEDPCEMQEPCTQVRRVLVKAVTQNPMATMTELQKSSRDGKTCWTNILEMLHKSGLYGRAARPKRLLSKTHMAGT